MTAKPGKNMMDFKLRSDYKPTGDQPQAIKALVDGFKKGNQFQPMLVIAWSFAHNSCPELSRRGFAFVHPINRYYFVSLYGFLEPRS